MVDFRVSSSFQSNWLRPEFKLYLTNVCHCFPELQCSESAYCTFICSITERIINHMIFEWIRTIHVKFMGVYQIICQCCSLFNQIRSTSRQVMLCTQVETIFGGFNAWLCYYTLYHYFITYYILHFKQKCRQKNELEHFCMMSCAPISFRRSSLPCPDNHENHYSMA